MPSGFNRLLVAWFASVTADGMRFAALPLLALTVSPSPAAVSAVAAATTLPWLLVALPAGALVDRLDPVAVIAWVNAGRALAAAVLVTAVAGGWAGIGLLCAVGFLLTAGETFADSAGQSLLVKIVPRDRLEAANARFVGSENIGLDLIGPLASGALFVVAHWLPFAIAAGIFLFTAYGVLGLRNHRAAAGDSSGGDSAAGDGAAGDSSAVDSVASNSAPGDKGARGSVAGGSAAGGSAADGQGGSAAGGAAAGAALTGPGGAGPASTDRVAGVGAQRLSVRAGFRVIFADPQLRTLVITVAIMSAAIAAAEGVLVIYSDSSLRLPPVLYPTLLACYSVGLVMAAAAVSRWGAPLRPGAVMVGAVAVIGTTLLVMGLFPDPLVAWWSFLAMGAAGGVWNVLSASRRQRRTPPAMVARVSSTFRAISWGALPLGSAIGGWIAQARGVTTAFIVSGLVVLVLAAIAGRFLVDVGGDVEVAVADEASASDRSGAAEPV